MHNTNLLRLYLLFPSTTETDLTTLIYFFFCNTKVNFLRDIIIHFRYLQDKEKPHIVTNQIIILLYSLLYFYQTFFTYNIILLFFCLISLHISIIVRWLQSLFHWYLLVYDMEWSCANEPKPINRNCTTI